MFGEKSKISQRLNISRHVSRPEGRNLTVYAGGLALKRGFDLLVSVVFLCTLFPPVFLIVGTAVKCTSPGPVLFRQQRHGKNGRVFTCLKFRTMRVNDTADTQPAQQNDSRITPLGRCLRRTFIDELPQFINVLRGDMSIIGPRPHMLDDTRRFALDADDYMSRLTVRPGITGLAQVKGYTGEIRTQEDLAGRIWYDLYYIEHWSFSLDVCIFLRTLRNFLTGGNYRKLLFKQNRKTYV